MQHFDEQDQRRLTEHPWLRGVEFYQEIDSTNRRALECCQQFPAPHLVVAETQTAGRGRGGSRWWSGAGGLMMSLTIDAAALRLTRHTVAPLSLATGLAVWQTLAEMLGPERVRLKWPNDVYVEGRKICGILLETSPAQPLQLVVGIGLNVHNSLASAPAEVRQPRATTLSEHLSSQLTLLDVLEPLLDQLRGCFEQFGAGRLRLRERWRPTCLLWNRHVVVETPQRRIAGRCDSIDDSGALLVQTEHGIESIVAGAVVELDGKPLVAP